MPESIGSARKTHPIPMRLRNARIDKELGGAKGYRGKGYTKARKKALYLGRYRSTITGKDQKNVRLMVDHIIPYGVGGVTPDTNKQANLRVSDFEQNKHIDFAEGFQEKPVKRRMRF